MRALAFCFLMSIVTLIAGEDPTGLLCSGKPSPSMGAPSAPLLSWIVPHVALCEPNQVQEEYTLQVSTSVDFSHLEWNTTTLSNQSFNVRYDGTPLVPGTYYFWRVLVVVRSRGGTTCKSGWSPTSSFVTSLWDGFASSTNPVWAGPSARYALLRKAFVLPAPCEHAVAFVTASQDGPMEKLLSSYRLYVNGDVVSVGPGRGDVSVGKAEHTMYDVVDIAPLLHNTSEVVFGLQCYHHDGQDAKAVAEFHLMLTDGTKMVISTNATWSAFDATKVFNPTGNTGGDFKTQPLEYIDASQVQLGWQQSTFKENKQWHAAVVQKGFGYALRPKATLPVTFTASVVPVQMVKVGPGHWFFDLGIETMGGIHLEVPKGIAGKSIDLRLSEELVSQHTILYPMRTRNTYQSTWTMTDGLSVFEHHEYMGFRYGELKSDALDGLTGPQDTPFRLSAWSVAYPWYEGHSSFASSDQTLNDVWHLCRDTLKVTSLDTFTDSNTRERLPYEADGFITASSRFHLQREFTWARHSTIHNARNPTWPTEWRQTTPLLAALDYMHSASTAIASQAGMFDVLYEGTQGRCVNSTINLVDFRTCARTSGTRDVIDWPQESRDGYKLSDVSTVISSYAVASLGAMEVLARAMNMSAQEMKYRQLKASVTQGVREHLSAPPSADDGVYFDGLPALTQDHKAFHATVFPAWSSITERSRWKQALAFLKKKGMAGSVYAAFAFLQALYNMDDDHGSLALSILTSCDDNSWCHMIKAGATATMEAWTRKEKPNLTWSHPWATAPSTAVANGLIGLRPTSPGYSTFELKPQLGSLLWAESTVPALSGFFTVAVNQTSNSMKITVAPPANTIGRVCLPAFARSDVNVVVDGATVRGVRLRDYVCVDGIGSSTTPRVLVR